MSIKNTRASRQLNVPKLSNFQLIFECDELWSFVLKKDEKQLVWIAKDLDSGYVVGLYIGSLGRDGAQGLWNSLPPDYQEFAEFYTDFWDAYNTVFPEYRHAAVGKKSGQTNHI